MILNDIIAYKRLLKRHFDLFFHQRTTNELFKLPLSFFIASFSIPLFGQVNAILLVGTLHAFFINPYSLRQCLTFSFASALFLGFSE